MELPAIIGAKYRVLRELARGGMGVVYVVEHQGTGEELALKLMSERLLHSPEAIERFKREARAPTRIRSEHVVRVIDADTASELGGAPFLVMELLDGDDLEHLCTRAPPPPRTVVDWLTQAARALDRAHALGFVHRDLKPANLFLARRSEGPPIIKVLDFGIVKVLEGAGATDSGASIGTPRYMAPEQVLAERGAVGPAADVWAMGLVAFRLLTGEDYWRGDTNVMLIGSILHGTIASPKERGCDLGPAFDAWFLRSCSREPAARFPSVGEQMRALAAALGSHDAQGASERPAADDIVSSPRTSSSPGTSPSRAQEPAPGPIERTGDAVSLASPDDSRSTGSSRASQARTYAVFGGFLLLVSTVTWWVSTRGASARPQASVAASIAKDAPSVVAPHSSDPPFTVPAPSAPDSSATVVPALPSARPSAGKPKAQKVGPEVPIPSAAPLAPSAMPSSRARGPLADPL